jgi:hypothetical protein
MNKKNIELWILCILILCIVAGLTWYTLRKQPGEEPFQLAAGSGSGSIASKFWELMEKQNEPAVAAKIAKVSDPDPNDENDPLPLSFPSHISIFALATYGDVSGARAALFSKYDELQKSLSTGVTDQAKVAVWTTSSTAPLTQTCNQLNAVKAVIQTQIATLRKTMQDISGTQVVANAMKNENMAHQIKLSGLCQIVPPPDICKNLASQDGPLFPLLTRYDNINDNLSANEEDVEGMLQTVNDTYQVLGCGTTNFTFNADSDIGYINTDELRSNLQRMSPYYLSPDTLRYISSSIVPRGDQLPTYTATTADTLINIRSVITNIKRLTNTP